MKNVLILTAMFLSSAALADNTTTVTQPVKATVQNTCIVVVGNEDVAANGGVKAEATGGQNNTVVGPIIYKANAKSDTVDTHANGKAGSTDGGLYAFRCTSGTNFTAKFGNAGTDQDGATGTIILTSALKATSVTADFKIARIDIADGAQGGANNKYGPFTGDIHAADAEFSIAAGQWSAKASDDYKGNLVVDVTFN